ncbi:MAG TPA: M20/M25/M40 family metallo-hydrolase, partial [Gemmatimonadales bacterium]
PRGVVPAAVAALSVLAIPSAAQTFPTDDTVIKRIWEEGMTDKSRVGRLAQVLLDSIGPRLTGSPGHQAGVEWLLSLYRSWGIPARKEQYGTWRGWRRGYTHLDLIAPRTRSLEGILLAWSPGTSAPVEGEVVVFPEVADSAAFDAWLPQARGKFVLQSFPEPTCRPDDNWERLARPETVQRMKARRDTARTQWSQRGQRAGRATFGRLEAAGAAAILTSSWSNGWGVNKVFGISTRRIPVLDVSCEDYGLLYRLAANRQGPRVRLDARSESLGEVPVFNVVGELRGTEKPNEYVLLSAHFDSWDAASGATDNGTGTLTMLEAMRLLKLAYPSPKRTILVGHWGGEEQGLIGSRAFAEDHRDVVDGLHAAFNQDNGTWRIEYIRMMGLTRAGEFFGRWLSKLPREIESLIDLDIPGEPERGGSDHMSFLCEPAPAFRLQSHYPDYRQYTWHTNRDTYDKIVFDDLQNNATLAAMLAYLAAEDPERMPRDRRVLPAGPGGQPQSWPGCGRARRSSGN